MANGEVSETNEAHPEDEVKGKKKKKGKGSLFSKLMAYPISLVKGMLGRVGFTRWLWQYLKTHRLLSLIVAAGAGVMVFLLVLSLGSKPGVQLTSEESSQAQVQYSRVTVEVPKGAYAGKKSFQVIEVKEGSPEYLKYKELAGFEGPIYKIVPTDGRDELALKPVKIRYVIDPSTYPGDEFNHFVLRYVTLDNPPVVSTINGCEVRGDTGRYIEGLVFRTSFVVGLVFEKPKYADFGIKLVVDRPPSLKPDLLVIPGVDQNFAGIIPNTQTSNNPSGSNFWGLLFPDRTIWVYKYPLITTRPRNYTRALEEHFKNSPVPSYISFEAKRLAAELKRLSTRTFDVIAQGIGGLIARYALESDPTIKNVRSLVLMSVPNIGTDVTNPIYLAPLYGRPLDNLSEIFGMEKDDLAFLISSVLGTLEKTNAYWNEILPSSLVITKLKEFGIRKDIRYLFVGGTTPPGNIDLAGTDLEKFFPEFVKGDGDGFVTVESAIPVNNGDNVKSLLFPYSSQSLYFKNDVLQALKDFLESGIEIPKPPEFETDRFVETKRPKEVATTEVKWKPYNLPNLKPGKVLKLSWKIEAPSLGYPLETPNGFYIVGKDGVFFKRSIGEPWKRIITASPLCSKILDDGSLLLCYSTRLEFISGDSVVSRSSLDVNGTITDAYFDGHSNGIVVVDTAKGSRLLHVRDDQIASEESLNAAYAELKTSGDLLLVITDTGIRALNRKTFKELWQLKDNTMVERLKLSPMSAVDPVDAEAVGDDLFVLFKDYMVGVFHLQSSKAQVVASGETGANRLLSFENRVFVLGSETITGFNTLSRQRFPSYQEIDGRFWGVGKDGLISVFKEGGKIWLASYSPLF